MKFLRHFWFMALVAALASPFSRSILRRHERFSIPARRVSEGIPRLRVGLVRNFHTTVISNLRGEENAGKPSEVQEHQGDMICGPRCVHFLLRHYGKEADLMDLVRETQWPNFEAGANLDALERSLRKRGIHTHALRIDDAQARIRWPHPVLVHLKGGEGVGHYVVWLPSSSGDRAEVWVGLPGIQSGSADRLAERRSGVVSLTSPEPIANPESAFYRPGRLLPWAFVALGLTLLAVVIRPSVFRSLSWLCLFLTKRAYKCLSAFMA